MTLHLGAKSANHKWRCVQKVHYCDSQVQRLSHVRTLSQFPKIIFLIIQFAKIVFLLHFAIRNVRALMQPPLSRTIQSSSVDTLVRHTWSYGAVFGWFELALFNLRRAQSWSSSSVKSGVGEGERLARTGEMLARHSSASTEAAADTILFSFTCTCGFNFAYRTQLLSCSTQIGMVKVETDMSTVKDAQWDTHTGRARGVCSVHVCSEKGRDRHSET